MDFNMSEGIVMPKRGDELHNLKLLGLHFLLNKTYARFQYKYALPF